MRNLRERYFEWIYKVVCGQSKDYHRLLHFLDETEFTYTIPMDGNRYEDGIDLRYRFGYEHDIKQAVIAAKLDVYPCSVLEMMIALAIRAEEHIMSNSELGDRTCEWFQDMLKSLGVDNMSDDKFDEDYVTYILERFLNREYEPDGEGGLFWIPGIEKDMRRAQIWDQCMWFLNTKL